MRIAYEHMDSINVGLLGFGNVGTGTYETLMMNRDRITAAVGTEIDIVKILVNDINKKRTIDVPFSKYTSDVNDIIKDPNIDIMVEVLGGIEPATSYMLSAMEYGKHVVTANKAAVAANYDVLHQTATDNHVQFRMEASVGGGIPVLSSITSVLRANRFEEILGILNGTTNYIMTQMAENGLSYEKALKQAQEKGFAEADPTADVEGIDVANKLSILMALAFDHHIHPKDIPTTGITKITEEELKEADAEGKVIKLIASATNRGSRLDYSVKPMRLPKDHPLAGVKNEFNAVFLKGNAVDDLMFYGKGAGPLPTGSAVAGDIVQIATEELKETMHELMEGNKK
ncbi:MAG: homoserine dehydrogenase [Anaerovoracaceae bacterium]|nr:homoserine dehydrogenase [Anaerovoracaceae bacterium]